MKYEPLLPAVRAWHRETEFTDAQLCAMERGLDAMCKRVGNSEQAILLIEFSAAITHLRRENYEQMAATKDAARETSNGNV